MPQTECKHNAIFPTHPLLPPSLTHSFNYPHNCSTYLTNSFPLTVTPYSHTVLDVKQFSSELTTQFVSFDTNYSEEATDLSSDINMKNNETVCMHRVVDYGHFSISFKIDVTNGFPKPLKASKLVDVTPTILNRFSTYECFKAGWNQEDNQGPQLLTRTFVSAITCHWFWTGSALLTNLKQAKLWQLSIGLGTSQPWSGPPTLRRVRLQSGSEYICCNSIVVVVAWPVLLCFISKNDNDGMQTTKSRFWFSLFCADINVAACEWWQLLQLF